MWLILLAAVIGYLLGSISFAVMVAKRRGVDIFTAGSGNPGATNVLRVLGKGPGYLVFFLDFLKGFVAAHWPMAAMNFGFMTPDENLRMWMGIAGLAGAVAGHSFSIFLKFRGGKGVATTIGGLMALMPLVTLGGLLVWAVVFLSTRYVSLASIAFGLVLMPLAALLKMPHELVGLGLVLALVILWRHRVNLQRLMNGTENKFEKKKANEGVKAMEATDATKETENQK
ncbi:MAG TPA: glycerol-3-phosphate 1-O-acyltransferase PlsY [Opitutales bacterium]|jgi:glycerol-3-phosphate acyltransferase PlsY|nr:glycerol-3-phosphate 1-O-acyltransferase PlsY [Opitutales bacterium]